MHPLKAFACEGFFCWRDFYLSFLRSSAHRYTHTLKARHSGMDCRNPGYMDVFEITIPGTGYPLPGGYDGYLNTCV